MVTLTTDFWRKCTTCKKTIGFSQKYWVCSVSTCNRIRTGLVFCDLRCFDAHVPVINHRDAGAFEKTSPAKLTSTFSPGKDVLNQEESSATNRNTSKNEGSEILVVVSKIKSYIREKSEMNTSDAVMEILSKKVREMANLGIDRAKQKGRKTVLNRDI